MGEEENETEDDDVVSLNEEENIHVAQRSLGLGYRGALTGADADSEERTVHVHGPQKGPAADEDAHPGFVIVRIHDVDEAADRLNTIYNTPKAADDIPDVSLAAPFVESYCAVCHERVNERAVCLYRSSKEALSSFSWTESLLGVEDFPREVWCHIDCTKKLASTLQTVWDHTDELIGDEL